MGTAPSADLADSVQGDSGNLSEDLSCLLCMTAGSAQPRGSSDGCTA